MRHSPPRRSHKLLTQPLCSRPFALAVTSHQSPSRTPVGVTVAPAGTVISRAALTPTGVREGDWWQVTTSANGLEQTGWVSSLWLRRGGE